LHCNKDYTSGSKIFHLEIDKSWFAENNLNPEKIKSNEINNITAKNIFINIVREFSIRDELTETSMQSLMLYLFNLLTRNSDCKKSIPLWRFNFDKIICEQTNNKQSLTNIAKKLNVHPVRSESMCDNCVLKRRFHCLQKKVYLFLILQNIVPIPIPLILSVASKG